MDRKPSRINGIHAGQPLDGDLTAVAMSGALYLHWTRTVAGKTVTRSLTPDQARRYQAWFDNARRIRDLLSELEARSLRAFEDAEA